jgi:Na+-transporting methylmalonyl-CoA/oxaloacetate decarboxylase gamma subunit
MITLSLCGPVLAAGGLGVHWPTLGVILLLVTAFMVLIRFIGQWAQATHPVPAAPAQVKSPSTIPATEGMASDELTPEVIAVLTAAASLALGSGVRLLGIREVAPGNATAQQAWSREGRREIYLSHRIR